MSTTLFIGFNPMDLSRFFSQSGDSPTVTRNSKSGITGTCFRVYYLNFVWVFVIVYFKFINRRFYSDKSSPLLTLESGEIRATQSGNHNLFCLVSDYFVYIIHNNVAIFSPCVPTFAEGSKTIIPSCEFPNPSSSSAQIIPSETTP